MAHRRGASVRGRQHQRGVSGPQIVPRHGHRVRAAPVACQRTRSRAHARTAARADRTISKSAYGSWARAHRAWWGSAHGCCRGRPAGADVARPGTRGAPDGSGLSHLRPVRGGSHRLPAARPLAAISPDACHWRQVVAGGSRGGTIKLWDLAQEKGRAARGRVMARLTRPPAHATCANQRSARWPGTARASSVWPSTRMASTSRQVCTARAVRISLIRRCAGHILRPRRRRRHCAQGPTCLPPLADSARVRAETRSGAAVQVWEVRQKGCLQTYRGHQARISALKHTPDGRWIASGDQNGARSRACCRSAPDLHPASTQALSRSGTCAWARRSRQGFAISREAQHVTHGTCPQELQGSTRTTPVTSLDFHPNEFLMSVGSGEHFPPRSPWGVRVCLRLEAR
jgi:hypothetical protein